VVALLRFKLVHQLQVMLVGLMVVVVAVGENLVRHQGQHLAVQVRQVL
jgi:hypothetical protein